jgi:uncharacterized protein
VIQTSRPPVDAQARRSQPPVIVYPVDSLPRPDMAVHEAARATLTKAREIVVPPRDGRAFRVPRGHYLRIVCIEGPQVADFNLWNAADLTERFYSGKTRALHRTHLTTGDRLWSTLPHLRPLATITQDTLAWYGWDNDGAGVHDVIGTRCDPYTHRLLSGEDYHRCCHSNLARALSQETGLPVTEAELYVHDVMNVFMCSGFTRDTHQYFMKASPARPGDFIEFFAELDVIGAISTCPGGDCGATHSSDVAQCHPLRIEILRPSEQFLAAGQLPEKSSYSRSHGI